MSDYTYRICHKFLNSNTGNVVAFNFNKTTSNNPPLLIPLASMTN